MMPKAGRAKVTPELRTWPWLSSVPSAGRQTSGSPSSYNTLSPHRRSAPECLSLLIPDKPEPPAQRGREGWTDRVKERRERGGGGQKPGAEPVGGIKEAEKTKKRLKE